MVARRQLLSKAVQATAAGGLAATAWHDTSRGGGPVDAVWIRWDDGRRRWPQRPARPAALVVFDSTGDAAAPAPRDFDLLAGDVWWRHPRSNHLIREVTDV